MPEFFSIDRDVLLARPTKKMLEWVSSLYPDEEPEVYQEKASHDNWDVFLLPETDDWEESLKYVKENCAEFLAIILDDWCMEEDRWPSPLDWTLFEDFVEYSIQTVVMDTVGEEEE